MSVFNKHRDTLERHETMMGTARGRLAVAMDLLTDSLALVGQHGIYCRSDRFPGKPKMDIALVLEQLGEPEKIGRKRVDAQFTPRDRVAGDRAVDGPRDSSRRSAHLAREVHGAHVTAGLVGDAVFIVEVNRIRRDSIVVRGVENNVAEVDVVQVLIAILLWPCFSVLLLPYFRVLSS
jgi:hypothetical protein